MLTLCICDDSPEDSARIRALVDCFAGEHPEFPFQARAFLSPFDLLEHLEARGGFDLYILDIYMPHMKGVELAERIRARGEAAEILFLTVSRDHALDAFDVDACGYLVKPVDPVRFEQLLLSAARRLTGQADACLLLKTREGLRRISFRELVMVESFNHERVITLADGSRAVTADTLISLRERLAADPRFFSPHRAYIVNLEHIAALHAAGATLSTGQRVPVSRASSAALKKAYMDYLFSREKSETACLI